MSMTIDRICSIDPIQGGKKPEPANRVNKPRGGDIISISSEAKESNDLLKAQQLVAAAADVRAERISELKEKINDPSYINDRVVNATADRLMETLFG